jgi:2-isopropylmalate synthase
LGKHSGRAAVRARFDELGISFDSQSGLDDAFRSFKELADKKHEIFDEDLQALVSGINEPQLIEKFTFSELEAISKSGIKPSASLILNVNGKNHSCESEGDGLVDAAFKAIEAVAKSKSELKLYLVSAVTEGTDSLGEVTVRLEKDNVIVNGIGTDTDIIAASVKAYLNALNLLDSGILRAHPQKDGI